MPRHNPSGRSKGRGGSPPRSHSTGKSFARKSEDKADKKPIRDSEKPFRKTSSTGGPFPRREKFSGPENDSGNSFKKSSRNDFKGKPSFSRRDQPETEKKTGFSGDSRAKKSYKKFDKRGSISKSPFSQGDKPSYPEAKKHYGVDSKRSRPYKKFDKEDKPRPTTRRSSFPGASKEEKPYEKFDKASNRNPQFSKRDKPPYKTDSPSDNNPHKKFDRKYGSPDKPTFSRGGSASNTRPSNNEGPYKNFDKRKSDRTLPIKTDSAENKRASSERGSRAKSDRPSSQNIAENKNQGAGISPQAVKIRLNKFIANSGVCSRREADELITMGLISVNGKTITELGYKVDPGDEVRHESKVLRAEKPVYILLNKPKGFLTTTADPQDRNTVMHLIGNIVKERVYPVGRLDRNTTGLLLLTNDGDLAEKLMHPSYDVKKIYKVELDRPLTKADAQHILEGVKLQEGRAIVDDLAVISDDRKTVGIEIHIGWNRVVRRIFESLEYTVVKLDRSVYAGLNKKDLGRGEWRFLKKEELVLLKHFK